MNPSDPVASTPPARSPVGPAALALLLGAGLGVAAWWWLGRAPAPPVTTPDEAVVPAHLLTWAETGGFDTGLEAVEDLVACRDGGVAVVGGGRLRKFTGDAGSVVFDVACGEARSLCERADGALWACLSDAIATFAADGRDTGRLPLAPPVEACAIAAGDDAVYVADAAAHPEARVRILDVNGMEQGRSFGQAVPAEGFEGLKTSSTDPRPFLDLAWDPAGELLVVNIGRFRIDRFDPTGKRLGGIGHAAGARAREDLAGFVGCCNPIAFTRLADGRLATCEKGVGFARVKVLDVDGGLSGVVAPPAAFGGAKFGAVAVAADEQGRLLLLDAVTRRVRIFAEGGGR